MSAPIFLEHTRGPRVESRHPIHALWVDEKGREIESWGDTDQLICPRSSFKPIQVLPYVLSKAFEKAPDPIPSLALAMASHSAESVHTNFVSAWLQKLGLRESDLVCGTQWPRGPERIWEMARLDQKPTRIHNNCSGKHTGMLAACQSLGFELKGYEHWDHPLQESIRGIAGRLGGIDLAKAPYGIDGCGLPIYYLPMNAFAKMGTAYLRPDLTDFSDAIMAVRRAWQKHPIMVGGENTLDTRLAQVTKGRVVSKIGAQGNYIALDFERGRCFTMRIESGFDLGREQALLEFLVQSGSLSAQEEGELRLLVPREIGNWEGTTVGIARVNFSD